MRQAFDYGIVWLNFGRAAKPLPQLSALARAITGRPGSYGGSAEARADLSRLIGERRLLVILDDVWEPELIDSFRDLAPGCRLLITTRKRAVVDRASAATHEIGLLEPRAARAFLAEAVNTADLPAEADAILRECGGLPLALAASAALVRRFGWDRPREAFARARLDTLKTNWLPGSEYQNLAVVLAASVDELPPRERDCLLTGVRWPEDAIVPEEALDPFWSEHVPDRFDIQEVTDMLVGASVLQGDGEAGYRLHDLYHDYLRHVAGGKLAAQHGALADRCVKFDTSGPKLLDTSSWTLDHLPWHLVKAGRAGHAKALN